MKQVLCICLTKTTQSTFVGFICNSFVRLGNHNRVLGSIIDELTQYPFFVRFRPFFLRFCFFLKKYALFHPHFYKSISVLSRLLYIDKNFVQKFSVSTIRAIFQNRAVPLYKKMFSENFCPIYVAVWLVRKWTYKTADAKAHTFSRRSKNVQKNGRKTATV